MFKGQIARAARYMAHKYPVLEDRIARRVIDPLVALEWSKRYPPTDQEVRWNAIVRAVQHDGNVYVSNVH